MNDSKIRWKFHLPTRDLLIINDESIGHRRGQFDGLYPESHMSFLQNLVVQIVFEWDNCTEMDDPEKLEPKKKKKKKVKKELMGETHWDAWWSSWAPTWCSELRDRKQQMWVKQKTNSAMSRFYWHDSPSSVRVWLEETPSVSVTTTEYRPRSSLSGLVKVSLDLRTKVQTLETIIWAVWVWWGQADIATGRNTLVLPSANLRPALCCHRHSGAVADWLVVLGPHKLGCLTDLTGFKGEEDVSSLLIHTGNNFFCACPIGEAGRNINT